MKALAVAEERMAVAEMGNRAIRQRTVGREQCSKCQASGRVDTVIFIQTIY